MQCHDSACGAFGLVLVPSCVFCTRQDTSTRPLQRVSGIELNGQLWISSCRGRIWRRKVGRLEVEVSTHRKSSRQNQWIQRPGACAGDKRASVPGCSDPRKDCVPELEEGFLMVHDLGWGFELVRNAASCCIELGVEREASSQSDAVQIE